MQEFIDSLNLPYEGDMKGNQYIVKVNNSDEWSELFNTVDLNTNLHLDQSLDSIATVKESKFIFTDGVYNVILEADFVNDIYKLTAEEK